MRILLHDISKLYRVADKGENQKAGNEMQVICMLENAWLKVENGKIHSLGTGNFPNDWPDAERVIVKEGSFFQDFAIVIHI